MIKNLPAPSVVSFALAVLLLGSGAENVWAKGEALVKFEDLRSADDKAADPDDTTTGSAILELYRRHYNKPNAALTDLDFDAFLTYQASVSEFLMKPELHEEAELNYNKAIKNGNEKPNLYYISTWMANSTTSFDNSGNIRASRRNMANPKMGMEGKPLYFPSEEAIAKLLEITKATQEAAAEVSNSDPTTVDRFLERKEELEKELLKAIAEEIAKMRDLAAGQDVYGLGYIDKDGEPAPIRLDMDMLKSYMANRGIQLPPPAGTKTESGEVKETAITAPVVNVRQGPGAQRDMDQSYEQLMQPLSEHERTKREIEGDLFRIRGRAADFKGENVKTYDPFMTFELQHGGLSLPSVAAEE
ncbi:MAG: hypothetical protein HYY25_15345 [Candidatus Wallbacteria bacterium]|nr:hypothetical protein [Candidatus Wallbacteria bacterium]